MGAYVIKSVHSATTRPKKSARATFDYVNAAEEAARKKVESSLSMPWALVLAHRCLDMATGGWVRMPERGPVMNQDDTLMSNITVAWRTWYIHSVKTANDHTEEDIEFSRQYIFVDDNPRNSVET